MVGAQRHPIIGKQGPVEVLVVVVSVVVDDVVDEENVEVVDVFEVVEMTVVVVVVKLLEDELFEVVVIVAVDWLWAELVDVEVVQDEDMLVELIEVWVEARVLGDRVLEGDGPGSLCVGAAAAPCAKYTVTRPAKTITITTGTAPSARGSTLSAFALITQSTP